MFDNLWEQPFLYSILHNLCHEKSEKLEIYIYFSKAIRSLTSDSWFNIYVFFTFILLAFKSSFKTLIDKTAKRKTNTFILPTSSF